MSEIWDVVFAYSEWLDAEQELTTGDTNDPRTHEDLVNEFFAERGM